jgi:choloylglycine hydrolase
MSRMYALLITMAISLPLHACTGILLKTLNGSSIYARTLEFGEDLSSHILLLPRKYTLKALAPSGKPEGLTWTSKYAAVGINAFKSTNFIDGVNEQGLAGGVFYFPGFAEYQDILISNYQKSLPMWTLLTWILTNFATVAEVKAMLPTVYVSKTLFPGLKKMIPAHLIVHDAAGNSLVIEYVNGKLFMYDNSLGVITNSPTFDWHLTNIRNYLNLSPRNAQEKKIGGITFSPFGQGSGMVGLPGDFTPPSRFIRAVAFSQAAPKQKTELDTIHQAFRILNNFDIPKGIVVDKNGQSEYTAWTSATDMKNKIFYFRPYANFQLQKIDLMKMNLDAPEPRMISMERTEEIVERSSLDY